MTRFVIEIENDIEETLDMIKSLNAVKKVATIDDSISIDTIIATTVSAGRYDKMVAIGKITEILENNIFTVQRITDSGRKSNLTRNIYEIIPLNDFIDLQMEQCDEYKETK